MRFALALAVAAAAAAGCGEADEPAATRAANAGAGLTVWTAHGCGSCHAMKAAGSRGDLGPDLDTSLTGDPPEHIKESIIAPDLKADPGTNAGMMPANYAERIRPADLDALVAFIADSVD